MFRLFSSFRLSALVGLVFTALVLAGAGQAADDGRIRLLVGFERGSAELAPAILARSGAADAATIANLGVHVVTVPSGEASSALERLRSTPGVAFAEVDGVATPQELLPSDPSFPQTFAADRSGGWGWYRTHTTQAWDITTGSPSVVIAVLDTGLKPQGIADFTGQTVAGWNVITSSSDVSTNAGNHGTLVAGVVGLALDNGIGNAGYCPGCRIMPVQVGSDLGASFSNIATGITWAANHGAKVVNLSWASTVSSSTIQSAVDYARSLGVVVVAAAGNSNCDCLTYPAANAGVIGVAASNGADAKTSESNYGAWVELAAPSGNVTSWTSVGSLGLPGYASAGGTSLASPVVAGIAGLLFSAAPLATGVQIEQALETSAAPVGFTVAYGRVDALAALEALGFSDPQVASTPVNTTTPQIRLQTNGDWDSVPLVAAPQEGQVLLRGQGTWVGSAPLNLAAVTWTRCDRYGENCAVVGAAATYTVQTADTGYTLRVAVTVENGIGSVTRESALSLPVGNVGGPTAVTFRSLAAKRTARGVFVRWRTASELGTIGYNVYREAAGKRVRLNRSLISAGSGLSSHSYSWLDRNGKTGRYWVQAIGRNGARVWRGPAFAG